MRGVGSGDELPSVESFAIVEILPSMMKSDGARRQGSGWVDLVRNACFSNCDLQSKLLLDERRFRLGSRASETCEWATEWTTVRNRKQTKQSVFVHTRDPIWNEEAFATDPSTHTYTTDAMQSFHDPVWSGPEASQCSGTCPPASSLSDHVWPAMAIVRFRTWPNVIPSIVGGRQGAQVCHR